MEQTTIQSFLLAHSNKFNPVDLAAIRERLEGISEDKAWALMGQSFQDPSTIIMISVFAGKFGADRFMLGQTGLGVAKLLTCGGIGIWWVIDLFLIQNETRKTNYEKFLSVVGPQMPFYPMEPMPPTEPVV